ncbi:MAG: hypothetical protein EOO81_01550, partial [Oxalobacteraceae bacterium]
HSMGGNTLRTWDTLNLKNILDEAHENDVAVIAGLDLPVSGDLRFYNHPDQVNVQLKAYRELVNRYKSHPALLMWCLGNEVDFPYKPVFRHFYTAYNNLLHMIHEEDPDHPVTTGVIKLHHRSRWLPQQLVMMPIASNIMFRPSPNYPAIRKLPQS